MCELMNIKDTEYKFHAIDLGIAFQLTNIARDIIEDAKMNRIYIPFSWYKLNINEIKQMLVYLLGNISHIEKRLHF